MNKYSEQINSSKPIRKIVILVLLLTIIIGGGMQANYAYANRLLANSNITNNLPNLLESDQVVYYTTRIMDGRAIRTYDLIDPYHLDPKLIFDKENIVENWIGIDMVRQVKRVKDNAEQILFEYVRTQEETRIYDAISGLSFISPNIISDSDQTSVLSVMTANAWIRGSTYSDWGRLAWIIEYDADSSEISPSLIPTISEMKWHIEIDQETGLEVLRELQGSRSGEFLILYAEYNSLPEVLESNSIPFKWNEFATLEATTIQKIMNNDATVSGDELDTLLLGQQASLEELSRQLDFKIYVLETDYVNDNLYNAPQVHYNPEYGCPQSALSFDMSVCAGRDDILNLIYHNLDKDSTILIAQSHSEKTKTLLQNALPSWHSSRELSLRIEDRFINGWELIYEADENKLSIIFEVNETIVKVNGYNTDRDSLLSALQQLSAVSTISTEPTHFIFMPMIIQ